MGSSQSTHRSQPQDARENLMWALDESCHWEEEASIARLLLSEAAAYRPGQTSLGTVSRMDDSSRQRAIQLLKSTSDMTFVRIYALLKHGKTKIKDFPASHPARATLASRTFAAAATENLAANIDSLVVNNPAAYSTSTTPVPSNLSLQNSGSNPNTTSSSTNSGFASTAQPHHTPAQSSIAPISGVTDNFVRPNAEARIIAGPIDLKGTGTASPPALNAGDINAGEAFTPEKLAQQERIELAAKFLFIYSLLTKTTACAQHTYKLNSRFNNLRKSLKPKRAEKMDEFTLRSLRESHQRTDMALQLSLANFDRAQTAYNWLRRDYELSYADHRCNELLRAGHKLRDTMSYDDDARASEAVESRMADKQPAIREINTNTGISGSTAVPTTSTGTTSRGDTFYDPKAENRFKDDIANVNSIIDELDRRHDSLEIALQQNERDALNVAFDYLDAQDRGEITHEQCPQLGDRLWRALDTHAHGRITRGNMIKAIDNLSKRIDNKHIRIMEIQRDGGKAHNKSELVRLQDEFRNDRVTLRQLNQFFYQYFVEAVFSDIDGSVRQETVDIESLQNDIKVLEHALTVPLNPLASQNQPTQQLGSTGAGASNVAAQHQQVSASMIDSHQQELIKEDRIVAGPTFLKAEAGVPGSNIDKESAQYAPENRTAATGPGNQNINYQTGSGNLNTNQPTGGIIHNVPAHQEPYSQKIYEQSIAGPQAQGFSTTTTNTTKDYAPGTVGRQY